MEVIENQDKPSEDVQILKNSSPDCHHKSFENHISDNSSNKTTKPQSETTFKCSEFVEKTTMHGLRHVFMRNTSLSRRLDFQQIFIDFNKLK